MVKVLLILSFSELHRFVLGLGSLKGDVKIKANLFQVCSKPSLCMSNTFFSLGMKAIERAVLKTLTSLKLHKSVY